MELANLVGARFLSRAKQLRVVVRVSDCGSLVETMAVGPRGRGVAGIRSHMRRSEAEYLIGLYRARRRGRA